MSYTSKDYGLLFLEVNQDVYNSDTNNQNSFYPTSKTLGWNNAKSYVGEGNTTLQ